MSIHLNVMKEYPVEWKSKVAFMEIGGSCQLLNGHWLVHYLSPLLTNLAGESSLENYLRSIFENFPKKKYLRIIWEVFSRTFWEKKYLRIIFENFPKKISENYLRSIFGNFLKKVFENYLRSIFKNFPKKIVENLISRKYFRELPEKSIWELSGKYFWELSVEQECLGMQIWIRREKRKELLPCPSNNKCPLWFKSPENPSALICHWLGGKRIVIASHCVLPTTNGHSGLNLLLHWFVSLQ